MPIAKHNGVVGERDAVKRLKQTIAKQEAVGNKLTELADQLNMTTATADPSSTQQRRA